MNAMKTQIMEEPVCCLPDYGRLPISFFVDQVFEVTPTDGGRGGFAFAERRVDPPYIKDYDAIKGNAPANWSTRWDLSNWTVISSLVQGRRVGGAVLAFDTEGLDILEGRKDLAVLWDLRVHPDYRFRGIGRSLFHAAEAWAYGRGCRQLKVETQNINVGACRFYAKQGCILGAINPDAYRDFPEETQLFWYKNIQ